MYIFTRLKVLELSKVFITSYYVFFLAFIWFLPSSFYSKLFKLNFKELKMKVLNSLNRLRKK